MHELEGANPVNVAGELRFKDTDPPTDVVASDANALHLSLLRLVTAGGESPLANGAADAADDWMQIVRVTRKAVLKLVTDDILIDGLLVSPTMDPNKFLFRLTPDTSEHEDGEVSLDEDPANVNRLIFVVNETATRKQIHGGAAGPLTYLDPGRVLGLIGVLRSSVFTWEPIDGRVQEWKEISCKLYANASANSSAAFTVAYMRDERAGTVMFSFPIFGVSITITGSPSNAVLRTDANGDLPRELTAAEDGRLALLVGTLNGTTQVCIMRSTIDEQWELSGITASLPVGVNTFAIPDICFKSRPPG